MESLGLVESEYKNRLITGDQKQIESRYAICAAGVDLLRSVAKFYSKILVEFHDVDES